MQLSQIGKIFSRFLLEFSKFRLTFEYFKKGGHPHS